MTSVVFTRQDVETALPQDLAGKSVTVKFDTSLGDHGGLIEVSAIVQKQDGPLLQFEQASVKWTRPNSQGEPEPCTGNAAVRIDWDSFKEIQFER